MINADDNDDNENDIRLESDNNSSADEQQTTLETHINDLPHYILKYIFTLINQYADTDSAKLVCRYWHELVIESIAMRIKAFERCIQFKWSVYEPDIYTGPFLAERCTHSSCYHAASKMMYTFGGCTTAHTAFNDLWTFKLNDLTWHRVIIKMLPFPSPKALATLQPHGNNLLLYGGFSKSSPNPIHQRLCFFDELHLFDTAQTRWVELVTENETPKLAGHSASIVNDFMIVFGGCSGRLPSNHLWVLDIVNRFWIRPKISQDSEGPSARYGHSQVLLDESHLIVLGGCGGPNMVHTDCWLLSFSLPISATWSWREIRVTNPEMSAPRLWCHSACQVGENILVVSRGQKAEHVMYRDMRIFSKPGITNVRSTLITDRWAAERIALRRESSSNSSSTSDQELGSREENSANALLSSDSTIRLITSKSSDKHDKQSIPSNQELGFINSMKSYALQRACSIPTIIVGEIPKLVVTTSETSATTSTSKQCAQNSSADSRSAIYRESDKVSIKPSSSSPSEHQENACHSSSNMVEASVNSGISIETSRSCCFCKKFASKNCVHCKRGKRPLNRDHGPPVTGRPSLTQLLCVYTLNLSNLLSANTATWHQQDIEHNAVEETILYSICTGRCEVIVFGGMQTDPYCRLPVTHTANNKAIILRPRINLY